MSQFPLWGTFLGLTNSCFWSVQQCFSSHVNIKKLILAEFMYSKMTLCSWPSQMVKAEPLCYKPFISWRKSMSCAWKCKCIAGLLKAPMSFIFTTDKLTNCVSQLCSSDHFILIRMKSYKLYHWCIGLCVLDRCTESIINSYLNMCYSDAYQYGITN